MILFALREEAGPCKDRWRRAGFEVEGGADAFTVTHEGRRHRAVVCGPGVKNVLECLERENPESLIHAGFAGALRPDWPRGKVLVISAVQEGNATHEAPKDETFELLRAAGCDAALIESVAGPLNQDAKIDLSTQSPADLVDMESAAALSWARERKLPYTGVRIVSDRLSDEIPDSVIRSWDGRRFRIGTILASALRHPSQIPELNELRTRSRRLGEQLAESLLPIL